MVDTKKKFTFVNIYNPAETKTIFYEKTPGTWKY